MSEKICPKCKGVMMESYISGKFPGERENGALSNTDTKKYMCKECGYIEEYGINPGFYRDKN